MSVNTFATNAASNSAISYLNNNSRAQASSIAKLSSGSRIVKASDDAASLAVGTKLKADVTALKQAATNAAQAGSLLQIADGAMSRIGDTLMRMKGLATQARSDVLSNTERGYLDAEYQAMINQIDFISSSTKFNGIAVISGALGATYNNAGAATVNVSPTVAFEANSAGTYQIGYDKTNGQLTVTETGSGNSQTVVVDNTDDAFSGTVEFAGLGVRVKFDTFDLSNATGTNLTAANEEVVVTGGAATFQMGVTAGAGNDDIAVDFAQTTVATLNLTGSNITTINLAETASTALDTAIETINTRRAGLGAAMARVERIGENIATTIENLDGARSVLMDVDVAEEMTKFTTNQVMTQAATAMLAQANQLPQNLMRLLQ